MSNIIFEGNTYTFGATVSANSGTGTTSYVFGGLSSGSTYGFIIWAFNGFGPSSIVGPLVQTTLSSFVPESRNEINAFVWLYQNDPNFDRNAFTNGGNTYNLFTSSEDLSNGNAWTWANGTSRTSGFTAPDGSTGAWNLYANFSNSNIELRQTQYFDIGNTYIVSYYLNLSSSVITYLGTVRLQRPVDSFGQWIQIDPDTGEIVSVTPDAFGNAMVSIPVGATGWTRFNFMRYHSSFTRETNLRFMWTGGGGPYSFIMWGPQLEIANG